MATFNTIKNHTRYETLNLIHITTTTTTTATNKSDPIEYRILCEFSNTYFQTRYI